MHKSRQLAEYNQRLFQVSLEIRLECIIVDSINSASVRPSVRARARARACVPTVMEKLLNPMSPEIKLGDTTFRQAVSEAGECLIITITLPRTGTRSGESGTNRSSS